MASGPHEITLEITPRERVDLIDVNRELRAGFGGVLEGYRKAFYCSYHTTAGFLEQGLCRRLAHDPERVGGYVNTFREIFPPEAGYRHDRLELRGELSEEQRRVEPPNGDSHLAFIGAGLRSCVTYRNDPAASVFLVDLDGVFRSRFRRRRTTVVGFDRERTVARTALEVPMSSHPVDSVNLRDPDHGIFEQLQELVDREGIAKGCIDLTLAPSETHAGLTVNEYETMLMKHDLAEVLRNPFRFMAEKGRHMWADPRAIPRKTRNYAKYDLVQVVNQVFDGLGVSESFVEKVMARVLAVPTSRFLRMKRAVSLYVTDSDDRRRGRLVSGVYQSPILVQWRRAPGGSRRLNVVLTRFE